MGWDDIQGIVRHVLTTAGGALVSDGLINSSQLQDGVGAVVVLLTGWISQVMMARGVSSRGARGS